MWYIYLLPSINCVEIFQANYQMRNNIAKKKKLFPKIEILCRKYVGSFFNLFRLLRQTTTWVVIALTIVIMSTFLVIQF